MNNYIEKLDHATSLISEKKFDEALIMYKEILDLKPDEPILYECLANIGFLYYNNQQYDDAILTMTEAVLLPFTDYHGPLYKLLAVIYKLKAELEIASEYFLESLNYFDDNEFEAAISKYELAKILLELNDLDLAYRYFKELESTFKENHSQYYLSVIYFLGMCSFMKEEIELAESYFNVLLLSKDSKKDELVHGNYGMLHVANYHKNADEIFNYASKILELDSSFYDRETLTYMTVKAYDYQNREQEYFAALKLFIKDYPNGKYKDEYKSLNEKEFNTVN